MYFILTGTRNVSTCWSWRSTRWQTNVIEICPLRLMGFTSRYFYYIWFINFNFFKSMPKLTILYNNRILKSYLQLIFSPSHSVCPWPRHTPWSFPGLCHTSTCNNQTRDMCQLNWQPDTDLQQVRSCVDQRHVLLILDTSTWPGNELLMKLCCWWLEVLFTFRSSYHNIRSLGKASRVEGSAIVSHFRLCFSPLWINGWCFYITFLKIWLVRRSHINSSGI